ncbi:facilitated trehalose transporter Tret1-like [Macrobrachium nipponense]|uniref:facilitated trehalose transporter Tret1-like n=1 Tax=Macrobrachium nipponense TaxID=159736 RepID=UPI0030C7A76E
MEENKGSTTAKFLVVFCPLLVGITKHQSGFVIGWSAALPKIQADNSTSLEVADNDVKWLISLTGIAGMVGTLATGPIIETFGPRRILTWIQIPAILFWLTSAFTPYLSLLYFGRIGLCSILIISGPLNPLLVAELSDPKIRGAMLAAEEIAVATGMLIMYAMVQKLYWVTATALAALPASVQFLLSFCLPESPFWDARNGHHKKAEAALMKLRFSKAEAKEEFETLLSSVQAKSQSTVLEQIRELKHCRNYRPVFLLLAIYTLRELGGEFIFFNYTVYMFEKAKVQIDPFMCTILVGVTRTIASITLAFLLDRIGRRPLLIGTTLVCALASLICGVFLLLDLPKASWVPLAAILMYVASYGFGLGPIPWGLTGEMIPTPVRAIGGSICLFGYSVSVFAMSYLFPAMTEHLGMGLTCLSFTASLFALSIILFRWFPETKGTTLNTLEGAFRRKGKTKQQVFTVSGNLENSQDITGCEVTKF